MVCTHQVQREACKWEPSKISFLPFAAVQGLFLVVIAIY